MRFGGQSWSLLVPAGWRAHHDDECATLVGPGDVGALQISTASKDSDVTDADLSDFASDHLSAGAKPRETRAGDFVGFEIAFDDGDSSWRQWYLRSGRQILFVSYNTSRDSRSLEDAPVREALASLRVEGGHAA